MSGGKGIVCTNFKMHCKLTAFSQWYKSMLPTDNIIHSLQRKFKQQPSSRLERHPLGAYISRKNLATLPHYCWFIALLLYFKCLLLSSLSILGNICKIIIVIFWCFSVAPHSPLKQIVDLLVGHLRSEEIWVWCQVPSGKPLGNGRSDPG